MGPGRLVGIHRHTAIRGKHAGAEDMVSVIVGIDNGLYRLVGNFIEFSLHLFRGNLRFRGVYNDDAIVTLNHYCVGQGIADGHVDTIGNLNNIALKFCGMGLQFGTARLSGTGCPVITRAVATSEQQYTQHQAQGHWPCFKQCLQ